MILLEERDDVLTRVQVAWSDPEEGRLALVTVDDRGNPTRIELRGTGDEVAGQWFDGNGGEISCTR
jgi:hypothetical protein